MTVKSGAPSGSVRGLDREQRANAALITRVGKQLGATARDIAVAIMTSMDEASLHNLTGGDRDSAGLFQQRPSQGWGSYEQVTNPTYAATAFYRHLLSVHGRNAMSPWMEAQTVQRSGTSDGSNYERFWDHASNGFDVSATQIAGKELHMSPAALKAAAAGAGGSGSGSSSSAGGSGSSSSGAQGFSVWGILPTVLSGAKNSMMLAIWGIVAKIAFIGLGLGLIALGLFLAGKRELNRA